MAAAPFDRALVRELARMYSRAAVDQLIAEATAVAPVKRKASNKNAPKNRKRKQT